MKEKSYYIYDFLKLDFEEQKKIAVNKGRFIHFKAVKGKVYSLYALDLFFLQIRYEISGIKEITAFHTGHLLDLHCEINLDL